MEKPNNEKDQLPEEEINPGDDGVPEGGSISEDNHKPVVDGNANDKPPEEVENENAKEDAKIAEAKEIESDLVEQPSRDPTNSF